MSGLTPSQSRAAMIGHYALNGELNEVLWVECSKSGCTKRASYVHHLGDFGEDRLPEADARAIFEKRGWSIKPTLCPTHKVEAETKGR